MRELTSVDRFEALDGSEWPTREQALQRDAEIQERRAITSRLQNLRTPVPSNIEKMFGGYHSELRMLRAYNEDDLELLRAEHHYHLRQAEVEDIGWGKWFLVVERTGSGYGTIEDLYSLEDIRLKVEKLAREIRLEIDKLTAPS